jgi:NADH-quinone oxidoreductase subunit N
MMLFPASGDLLTMFVALEVLSLPLYLLSGLARRRRLLSQEAALKYFLLGAFSSGFFLYGMALVYGYAGTLDLGGIDLAIRNGSGNTGMLTIGLGLLLVGLLFKVGAVPFHSWTPDVYQGAPTAVTGFMAACTKIAAFGALLRLLYVGFGADRWTWQPVLGVIAVLTMLVGALLAVVQTDVKRMLGYSAVAHTGFLLTGVLGAQAAGDLAVGQVTSLQAVLFYLATYSFATLGAFAVVTLVRDTSGEATGLDRWAGAFAFFLLSMAGIPLTAGFAGKWAVFTVAMSAGAWPVVLVAITSSVIAIFFYVRTIQVMFFSDVAEGTEPAAVAVPSMLTSGTIAVAVLGTLVLGVVPGPLLELAADAGQFIR